jgi:hypothetical protein
VHFSLRGLMLVTAVVAIGTYWFVVRPTAIANRFVTAVEKTDFDGAKSLMGDDEILSTGSKLNRRVDRIYAEVLPREWEDIWRSQRQIILQFACHEDKEGAHVEWTEDYELIADPSGITRNTFFRFGSTDFRKPPPDPTGAK